MMHNTEPEVQPPLQLLNVVRALVTAMRLRGPDLEAVARRIETYDNQPYPLT